MEHYIPPIPPLERILLSLSPDARSERFMSSKIPKTVAPPLSQLHRTNTHRIGRADCQAPFGTAWRQTPSSCHISYGAPWCRDRLVGVVDFFLPTYGMVLSSMFGYVHFLDPVTYSTCILHVYSRDRRRHVPPTFTSSYAALPKSRNHLKPSESPRSTKNTCFSNECSAHTMAKVADRS